MSACAARMTAKITLFYKTINFVSRCHPDHGIEGNARHDRARLGDFAAGIHADALPEGEAVAGKDAEELDREQDGVVGRLSQPEPARVLHDGVVAVQHPAEGPESVHVADAREDLGGQEAALGVDLHDGVFLLRVDGDADGRHDDDGRHDAERDERQLPLHGKRHGEGGHKGRYGLDRDAELLRDAVVDEVAVGGDMARDGTGGRRIKVSDLLSKNLVQQAHPQCFGGADGGKGDKALGQCQCQSSYASG